VSPSVNLSLLRPDQRPHSHQDPEHSDPHDKPYRGADIEGTDDNERGKERNECEPNVVYIVFAFVGVTLAQV